jgi:hypothetical protein
VLGQRLDTIKDILAVAAAIFICRHAFLDSGQQAEAAATRLGSGPQINVEQ